jgi:hypothetical protein
MPGSIGEYRPVEAAAAAIPLWISIRALWSRIRYRNNKDAVEGRRVLGPK